MDLIAQYLFELSLAEEEIDDLFQGVITTPPLYPEQIAPGC